MQRRLQYLYDLILVLTRKDLKVRYQSSFLGYFWSIGHPLAFAAVFYFAFKVILKVPTEAFALFLVVGLFPWQWSSNSIAIASTVFLANSSIIKKVNFPRSVIPLTVVLQDMLHFVLSIPVIMLFMLVFHKPMFYGSWVYGLPLLLTLQFFLTYGFALLISSINLFFRDLERLVTIFLTLFFYLTPVIYPLEMVPPAYRWLIYANPFSAIILSWRELFLDGRLDPALLAGSAGFAAGIFFLGYGVYRRLSWKFAEVV